MSRFAESVVEDAALAWLKGLGWRVVHGPDIAPNALAGESTGYGEVVLARRRWPASTKRCRPRRSTTPSAS